jgi:cyclomaltodextrinase
LFLFQLVRHRAFRWQAHLTTGIKGDGKTWSLDLELKYGRYQYKFVRNGSQWLNDPKADKNEDDGNGNVNSVIFITPPDFINSPKRGDGIIAESAIEHKTSLPYFNVDGETCSITLRTRKNDVDSVAVVVNGKSVETSILYTDELYEYHQAELSWNRKDDLNYQFVVRDGGKVLQGSNLQFSVPHASFKPYIVPSWVQNSVIYQIFPDRFENGNKSNDPKDVMPWDGKPTYSNRFGGDIAGVEKHREYLKSLGINAIYFNPIFKSPSNHRYEADDYLKVDPEFGTNAEFSQLAKSLHSSGIATILDFAFNHTSVNTTQFSDLVKNGPASAFKDWYFPKSFPVVPGRPETYEAWYGFASMPKLNTVNPATTEYLLKVCNYWIKTVGIDGMRLDVANEVNPNFWRTMRPYVKALNSKEWIVGEIWGDGNPWLQGDQFDSVMNYQFREAAIRFVAHNTENGIQFANDLVRVHRSYPPQVSRNMMNLLSTHDTPRFITECGGDRNLAKLGAVIQFTWVGEPSVYYGEELGMEGGKDPENRRGMEWSKATLDNDMLKFYRKIIAVRLVIFNRSSQPKQFHLRVPQSIARLAKKGLFDAFTGTEYSAPERPITVDVKPRSFVILVSHPHSNSSRSSQSQSGRGSVQRRANLRNRSQQIK